MRLSEIKHVLAASGIRLTKSLGQNFLHDGNQLRRIVQAAELTRSDRVLEIGPGLGPLTELLIEQAGEVLAIEKDARLVELLRQRLKVSLVSGLSETDLTPLLRLVLGDGLEFLRRTPCDWSDWKLVANLPYSVASAILVELAQVERCPQRMVVTVQLEVAQRIVAAPGNRDYGMLSLLLHLHYESKGFFKIPASCFFPEPDVDSACVTLTRRPHPLLTPQQSRVFTKIIKRSFSQRRKMLLKLLKEDWPLPRLTAALNRLQLAPQVRAETVSLEQFVRLTEMMHASAPP
jgi:16S rRNA (adenine1518-N6/adenine1519-N6)-dimethyltransferase